MSSSGNIEVVRNSGENATNLIRRFTRRLQSAGVLPRVRSNRYSTRPLSKFARKKKALSVLLRKEFFEEQDRLGKTPTQTKRKR